ncbi:palmitoyltransferase [Elysia marginata]|uniref:Palmitoyltransferase n=1 Tax=Elysia marginata TaxID=1093978 RepID=A0AAV4G598_9GAST|nr:palmitoyltransferase [Elysia marginata]
MTPLHRACLIGEYNIVLLLVQANADVNAVTNFAETPLHYASKRGIPTVVHLLLQCGAKVELRDKNGRVALHHAAENGAVNVVRYFQDAFNLDLQTLDNNYQSALHLACVHGQIELFLFLIKTGSSDLHQRDIQGNLPIHITAKNGYGFMTWTLLCILGVSVLKQTNKAGMTPLDLVSQSDSDGHKELLPLLECLSNQPDSTPVTGPVWSWYARLLFPFSSYLLLVIISQHLTSHQYLVFGAGLALAAFIFKNLSHRMHDVSRWPEPFYAGFFYGGVLHTTLCFFWHMLPCILF